MTDEVRGGRGPSGPPWSVDLLADLHAGVLDREQSARLWPQVKADPAARAILDALESVRTDLGDLGAAPVAPMPAHFAARLDAALDAEARRAPGGGGVAVAPLPPQPGLAPVVDLDAARRKRNRMAAWAGGLLTAAAAAVAISIAVVPTSTTGVPKAAMPPSEQTQNPEAQPPLAASSSDLGGAIGKVGTTKDYGDLGDQAGLDRCLAANDVDPAEAQTIGVRPVTLDGKPGTMAILLVPGELGKFRVLVVEPDCSALADTVIG